jgi:hypothetical protein
VIALFPLLEGNDNRVAPARAPKAATTTPAAGAAHARVRPAEAFPLEAAARSDAATVVPQAAAMRPATVETTRRRSTTARPG